jgi:hypothetical protein
MLTTPHLHCGNFENTHLRLLDRGIPALSALSFQPTAHKHTFGAGLSQLFRLLVKTTWTIRSSGKTGKGPSTGYAGSDSAAAQAAAIDPCTKRDRL